MNKIYGQRNKRDDRYIDENLRQRRLDGANMCLALIEDLCVTLALVRSDESNLLDEDQIRRAQCGQEWEYFSSLCEDVPDGSEMTEHNLEGKDHEGYPVFERIILIPLDIDHLEQHLVLGIKSLINIYNKKEYEEANVYIDLQAMYDSQWFCQITLPLIENPVLANKYRELYKLMEKARKNRAKNPKYKLPKTAILPQNVFGALHEASGNIIKEGK